jgi:hypothetical protein
VHGETPGLGVITHVKLTLTVSFLFILSADTKYSFPRVTMPTTITATSAAVASPVAVLWFFVFIMFNYFLAPLSYISDDLQHILRI